VEKQTNLKAACSEVALKLTLCSAVKLSGGFDLHDKLFIDDHVEPLSAELFAFVHDTYANLPADTMAARQEFTLERHRIDVLEKPETQSVVYLEEGADDRTREGFFK
jgi:hypothetical protein